MYESNTTNEVLDVLRTASTITPDVRRPEIGPHDLLYALLAVNPSKGRAFLKGLAVSPAMLDSLPWIPPVAPSAALPGPYTYTMPGLAVMGAAEMAAIESGKERIDLEDLLFGLLAVELTGESQVLRALGPDLETLEFAFARALDREYSKIPSEVSARLLHWGSSGPPRWLGVDGKSLVVVADLDTLPASMVAEFLAALDDLHRAWGGGGLRIDSETVRTEAALYQTV